MAVSGTPKPKVPCKHSHFSSRVGKVKRGPHTELSNLSFSPWISLRFLAYWRLEKDGLTQLSQKNHKQRPELQVAGGGLGTDAGTPGAANAGMQLRNGVAHHPTRVPRE